LAGQFYTAFVVQNLWNWFVAEAVHGTEISYWRTLGFMILIYVLRHYGSLELEREERWKQLLMMVEACVPPENKQEVRFANQKLKSQNSINNTTSIGEAAIGTIALGLGWVIHTFLSP
jgi:hypothetical protein